MTVPVRTTRLKETTRPARTASGSSDDHSAHAERLPRARSDEGHASHGEGTTSSPATEDHAGHTGAASPSSSALPECHAHDRSPSSGSWRSLLTGAVAGAGATVSRRGLRSGRPRWHPGSAAGRTRHGVIKQPNRSPGRARRRAMLPQALASAALDLTKGPRATPCGARRGAHGLTPPRYRRGRRPSTTRAWLAENPSRLTRPWLRPPDGEAYRPRARPAAAAAAARASGVDKLQSRRNQGDLLLQLCCDDKLTLAHAQRVLLRTRAPSRSARVQDGFRHCGATRTALDHAQPSAR
ncbi:hypothetical protein QJS66_17760 [Kocuria rhizophila]|nr:hypothetical protein QJS66_17760 [Kocuria rhizophila]